MGFIRSLISFFFKLVLISTVILTAGLVVLAYFLKKDVDEIRAFSEELKNELKNNEQHVTEYIRTQFLFVLKSIFMLANI